MYLHLLQKATSGLDSHKQHAQAVLSISIPNGKFPNLIPPTIYNTNQNIISPQGSNHQEMNDGFRGKRRTRGDTPVDLQHQQQLYQDVNTHGNLNDSPNASRLLAAPLGQIDDFDEQIDGSSVSPAKRIRRHGQQSGGEPPSLPSMNANLSSTSQQQGSLSQPSLPNSPFVFFFRIERENLLERAKTGETQFQNTQQVVQTIEKKWESLPLEDRRIYEQLAAKDGERYKREMEEYQRKQQQLQEEHQRRVSTQGEHVAATNLQNMLFSGVSAGTNIAGTSTSTALHHPLDPRMQQVNVIAGLRPPLPTVAAATSATTTANAATNVAPSHHHFMPPAQPTSLGASSSHALYPNTITPPQNPMGVGGQPLPLHLPVHRHHSPSSSSVAAPPTLTSSTSNSSGTTIVLPPTQSMPLPAGMEIELGGRKYKLGYQYQYMTREEAQKYVKPYTAAQSETSDTQQGGPPSSPSS